MEEAKEKTEGKREEKMLVSGSYDGKASFSFMWEMSL